MRLALRVMLGTWLLWGGLSTPLGAQDRLSLTNVRFGLVCGDTPRVCEETRTIRITGTSRCVYNRELRPCTWYGYSFDYDLLPGSHTLACRWSSSAPQSPGNPDSLIAQDVTEGTFDLQLPTLRGHFINPQYALLVPGTKANVVVEHQSCSYNGRQVLAIDFTLVYGAQ